MHNFGFFKKNMGVKGLNTLLLTIKLYVSRIRNSLKKQRSFYAVYLHCSFATLSALKNPCHYDSAFNVY